MSMFAHGLYCTVCKGTFESRQSWIRHLLTESHQSSARQACLRWGKKERKCTIVVFSDKHVAKAGTLLEYFSLRDLFTIVTDFVWWPDRPRMGLMQFESRKKVKEVLEGLGKPVLQLPDCFLQFKEAVTYLDCEWSELICRGAIRDVTEESQYLETEGEDGKPKLMKNGDVCAGDMNDDDDTKDYISKVAKPEPNPPQMPKRIIVSNGNVTYDATSTSISPMQTNPEASSAWSLRVSEFHDLCKSAEIPAEENNKMFKFIIFIGRVIGNQFEVNMYRNWILKLYNPGEFMLLLHATRRTPPTPPDPDFDPSKDDMIVKEKLLERKQKGYEYKVFRKEKMSAQFRSKLGGVHYRHKISKTDFAISCDPLRNVEVQLGRLLEFYCTFDPCIKPFFSLVYLWAKGNSIRLAEKSIHGNLSNSNLPDPAALDWLVILFLCRTGVIPTVREIQEGTNSNLEMTSVDNNPTDVFLKAEPNFVKKWRDRNVQENPQEPEFVRKVLRLVKEFFKFLNELWNDKRRIMINSKDGESFSLDEFSKNQFQLETRLANHEISVLRNHLERVKEDNSRINMIHPLCLTWKLSLCNESIDKSADLVKETASRMKKFVSKFSNERLDLDLEEALIGPEGLRKRKEHEEKQRLKRENEAKRRIEKKRAIAQSKILNKIRGKYAS